MLTLATFIYIAQEKHGPENQAGTCMRLAVKVLVGVFDNRVVVVRVLRD